MSNRDKTNIAHAIYHINEALSHLSGLANSGKDKYIKASWHDLYDVLHFVTLSFREKGGIESRYKICNEYIEEDYLEEIKEV